MLLQLSMLICPVSHTCDGQKTCFPTMLQSSFFAHEIISLKLTKTQNSRKMRQFLNRAVINGLKEYQDVLIAWQIKDKDEVEVIVFQFLIDFS